MTDCKFSIRHAKIIDGSKTTKESILISVQNTGQNLLQSYMPRVKVPRGEGQIQLFLYDPRSLDATQASLTVNNQGSANNQGSGKKISRRSRYRLLLRKYIPCLFRNNWNKTRNYLPVTQETFIANVIRSGPPKS